MDRPAEAEKCHVRPIFSSATWSEYRLSSVKRPRRSTAHTKLTSLFTLIWRATFSVRSLESNGTHCLHTKKSTLNLKVCPCDDSSNRVRSCYAATEEDIKVLCQLLPKLYIPDSVDDYRIMKVKLLMNKVHSVRKRRFVPELCVR